jgi:hypothetical protein
MFFGSDQGGKTAAALTSFMTSCQRVKIAPFAYLKDALGRVASHPVKQLDQLFPANWPPVSAWARLTGVARGSHRHGFTGRVRNCRFTVLELANEQDIAYGQSWKLVRFLASLAVVLP